MFSSQEAVHAVTDRRVTSLMFSTRQTWVVFIVLSMFDRLLYRYCQRIISRVPLRFRRNASIFVFSYKVTRDLKSLSMSILFFSHRLDLSPNAFCPFDDSFMFQWGGDFVRHITTFLIHSSLGLAIRNCFDTELIRYP